MATQTHDPRPQPTTEELQACWTQHYPVIRAIIYQRCRAEDTRAEAVAFAWREFARRGERTETSAMSAAGHGADRANDPKRLAFAADRQRGYVDAMDRAIPGRYDESLGAWTEALTPFDRCGRKFPVLDSRRASNSPVTRASLLERDLDPDDPVSYRVNHGLDMEECFGEQDSQLYRAARYLGAGIKRRDAAVLLGCSERYVTQLWARVKELIPHGASLWAALCIAETEAESKPLDAVELEAIATDYSKR